MGIYILVAEDEGLTALELQQGLRSLGYEVGEVVTSGASALAAVAQRRPDLALIDIGLEGELDGVDTATRLRNDLDIPIVYMTGSASSVQLVRALATEPHGYLVKPFGRDALRAAVQLAIYRHRQQQANRKRQQEREERLVQSRSQAEHATRAKTDFLAAMSHEIRTPMNGVIGILSLLEGTLVTQEQREYLDAIRGSADTLMTVVNDILDLSKVEAGRFELESLDFELRALVQSTLKLGAMHAKQAGVALHLHIDEELPELVCGDPTRVRQVLGNLLSNALKFTAHGSVTLRVTRVGDTAETLQVLFEVQDTGPGMTAEVLARVFMPYVQGDCTTSRRYGGTGLGLVICQKLSHLMGGDIGVTSEPGVGSRFWFTAEFGKTNLVEADGSLGLPAAAHDVPACASQPLASLKRPEPDGPKRLPRVLVAEDDPVNQLVASRMLQRLGFSVDLVPNGAAAVRAVTTNEYDLVFMDCEMPELDGFAATRQIRAGHGPLASHLPIVAMTAHAVGEIRNCCLAAGMDDYLAKPVRLTQLEAMLGRWLPTFQPATHR